MTVNSEVTSTYEVDLSVRNATVDTSLTIGADMNSLRKIDLSANGNPTDNKIAHNAGTVTVSGNVTAGGVAGGTGVYEQSGGALNAGGVVVQSGGSYNLSGGSATTASMTMQNGGTGNFSAGNVNATNLSVGTSGVGTVIQSGTSAVTSAGLSIGAEGAYNLNGGTLTATGNPTIDGALTINGGTLTFDTINDNDITVGGDGLLKLESGTINNTATAATDLLILNSDVEISGGLLSLSGGQYKVGGEFKVIGDAATINIKRLNQGGGDYIFVMDSDGISTIANGSAGYINLGDVSITVDGSGYTGGTGEFTLFDASFGGSGLNGTSTVVNVTGFTGGLSGYITQDQTTDLVTLTVIPEPAVLGLIAIFGGGMLVARRLFEK